MDALDLLFVAAIASFGLAVLGITAAGMVFVREIPRFAAWLRRRSEQRQLRRRRDRADFRQVYPNWVDGDGDVQ